MSSTMDKRVEKLLTNGKERQAKTLCLGMINTQNTIHGRFRTEDCEVLLEVNSFLGVHKYEVTDKECVISRAGNWVHRPTSFSFSRGIESPSVITDNLVVPTKFDKVTLDSKKDMEDAWIPYKQRDGLD